MDALVIAQRAMAKAQAAVREEKRNVSEAMEEVKHWMIINPSYTGEEPALRTRQAALKEREAALKDREAALKDREEWAYRLKLTSSGPSNEIAMDIDSPAVSTISVEKAIEQLSAFVWTKDDETNKRNIYAVQESMETISPATSILNLKIQAVDGSLDLIYSQQIYDDEKLIGINMPVDELLQVKNNTIVLIG
ncbi:hypothetical protein HDU77_005045, partial [Chytriomyces hyalinus]